MKNLPSISPILASIVALLALATWLALSHPVMGESAAPVVAAAATTPAAHSWLGDAFPVAQAGFARPTGTGG